MIILMYTSFDIYTSNMADSLWRGEKPSFSFTQVLKQFVGLKFITDNSGRLFE